MSSGHIYVHLVDMLGDRPILIELNELVYNEHDVKKKTKFLWHGTTLTPIYTHLADSIYKIGWGWTPARASDLLEVVKRGEIDVSIVIYM
jgi:hypothetical protein